jgi:hypothetical protein
MKKLFMVLSFMVLTGCVATPVERKFPEAPNYLKVKCPDLIEIDPNTKKFSDVVRVVSVNYGLYQECMIKSESWINWYNTQKQIFESVK